MNSGRFEKLKKNWRPYAYLILPLVCTFCLNNLVYVGAAFLNRDRTHYTISCALDDAIPLRTGFIIIYVLAYLHWLVGYVVIGRESEKVCCRVMMGDVLAKLLAGAIFLIFPTMMVRIWPTGNSFCDQLTRLIFRIDVAENLFPSIHCLESFMVSFASLRLTKVSKGYKIFMAVFAVLVFASTVFVKQHYVADIAGGIVCALIGLSLSVRFDLGRGYEWLNRKAAGLIARRKKAQWA